MPNRLVNSGVHACHAYSCSRVSLDSEPTCTTDLADEHEHVERAGLGQVHHDGEVHDAQAPAPATSSCGGVAVFWPDLWCSFLMMSGGHHVTLALPPCIAWATEQETMSAQIPRLLLSRQRSLRLAVISILLVGRPTDFRKGSAAALPHDLFNRRGGRLSRKKIALGGTVRGPTYTGCVDDSLGSWA